MATRLRSSSKPPRAEARSERGLAASSTFEDEIPSWSFVMRALTLATVLALTAVAGLGQAEAKGCIKGALVGGIAGHMVGHGMAGAAAGASRRC